MLEVILWTVIGFVLIVVDLLFIPGGVLVIAGIGTLGYAAWLNYQTMGMWSVLVQVVIVLATLPKTISMSLSRVALKSELKSEDGYVGLDDQTGYVGLEGEAASVLRPSGRVQVAQDEQIIFLDCIAEEGFIEKGAKVKVIEVRGPSLVVTRL